MEEYDNNYYNLDEFTESNDMFEDFISRCSYKNSEQREQDPLKVSTITVVFNASDGINPKMIYERMILDDNIGYIEYDNDNVRGIKNSKMSKAKKAKKALKAKLAQDKRKNNKHCPFANQFSIGINCKNPEHEHKNPVCAKMFANGKIHMTGCKCLEEVKTIYNTLKMKLEEINTEYKCGDKVITVSPVKNLKDFADIDVHIEMINGTFRSNYEVNLNSLYKKIKETYEDDEVYVNFQNKSKFRFDLLKLGIYDEAKNKFKTPKISVYNSGAVNINSTDKDALYAAYDIASKILEDNFEELVKKEFIYDETFFDELSTISEE